MIKGKLDVLQVIAALLNKVQDHHIKTFFELNEELLSDAGVSFSTVKEAKEILEGIDYMSNRQWLFSTLKHIEGMCACSKSMDKMPEMDVDDVYKNLVMKEQGWSDFKIL